MDKGTFLKMLKDGGALYANDHVVLTSGRHSDGYVNFDPFFVPEREAEFDQLCLTLAELFADRADIEVVAGPETGGGLIAARVAVHLSRMHGHEVSGITAHKHPERAKDFVFSDEDRAFLRAKRVLVVDDVLTTGSSIDPTLKRLRECEAECLGLGLMVNRSVLTSPKQYWMPLLRSVLTLSIDSWTEEECAARGPCGRGVPINTAVGHGREYLAKRGQR